MAMSSEAAPARRLSVVRGDGPTSRDGDGLPYHGFARLTAVATAVLILAGALVTSHGREAALSVPDWPTTFGTFFPPLAIWLRDGVRFEHTHRVIAGTVAVLMLALFVWIQRREPRGSVRVLAAAALGAVLLQAVLGGMTVLLKLPHAVSASHGTLAQTFFCLVVALAMVTSPTWRDAVPLPLSGPAKRLRTLALSTTAGVWLQLVIGAVTRHLHAWADIPTFPLVNGGLLPAVWTTNVAVHFAHRVGALVILALVGTLVHDVLRGFRGVPQLRGAARRLGVLVLLQAALGAIIILRLHPVVETSLHVLTGALVLVTSLVLTLWSYRLFAPARAGQEAA